MRVVITGAGGQLGRDLQAAFERDEVISTDVERCDVADRDAVLGLITTACPDVVVHAAAWTAVDACEFDPDRAWAVNALGSRHVADACRRAGAYLCALSTDYVFDGTLDRPYNEWDDPRPLSVYGRSKLGGEREILAHAAGASIVRTSWLCGAGGPNFVATMLRLAAEGRTVPVVNDQRGCPTFTADLAPLIRTLTAARLPGTFHATNQGPATTWYGFAQAIFEEGGHDPAQVLPIRTNELDPPRPAPRPVNSVLDNAALRLSGLRLLPDWRESLPRLVKELA